MFGDQKAFIEALDAWTDRNVIDPLARADQADWQEAAMAVKTSIREMVSGARRRVIGLAICAIAGQLVGMLLYLIRSGR